ncbi:MAG: DUF3461 family protein [Pseudomonadota bacterium]
MSTKTPKLTEMGVRNPEHIDSYAVSSFGYTDSLRITYTRPRGSLLPTSRTYRFPRVQKSAVVNPQTGKTEVVMESDVIFREAVEELKALLANRHEPHALADAMLREIHALEEEIAMRSACLRELAEQLKKAP